VVAACAAVCRRGSCRSNHTNLTLNQIGRHCGQPLDLCLRPPVLNHYIFAVDVTNLLQPFEESCQPLFVALSVSGADKIDYWQR
jgi:hypothetical protein